MKFDHVFIRSAPGAPAAQTLRALGLCEGSANRHPGQGTANRRFFFENGFLELLWIEDQAEVNSPATRPTGLATRLDPGADSVSPFGIGFRASAGSSTASFESEPYVPAYLPAGMQIDLARDAPLSEPMWFFFAAAQAPLHAPPSRQQPMQHALDVKEITQLRITVPTQQAWSEAAQAAIRAGIELAHGEQHLLELTFDHGQRGRHLDCHPALPMLLHL